MKKVDVYLASSTENEIRVGQLAEMNHRIYFEYDAEFLQNPLWLSPFKLPPQPGLHEHRDRQFGPIFGLFDDSLPDGWGLLLMDRWFIRQGIDPAAISPLDRLAYMGNRSMGALVYRPPAVQEDPTASPLNLHDMAEQAYTVLEGNAEEILPQLLTAGGSPGGARPKVLVGIKGDHMVSCATTLPTDYSGWIVKFHAKRDAIDDGRIEYAYSLMAKAAGIRMPNTRLFETQQGETFFATKRFDRNHGRRFHVHTFGNLIHSNFRIPACDYLQLLKIARVLTKKQTEVEAAFRLMVFNIMTHNRDDHAKNFAFMLDADQEWVMTPAYDLTMSNGPGGEHTMSVAGEGRAPCKDHIFKVSEASGIQKRRAMEIIEDVSKATNNWTSFADEAGLSKKATDSINKLFSA